MAKNVVASLDLSTIPAALPTGQVLEPISLYQSLIQGGWVMVPLLIASVIAFAVVVERLFWGMRRSAVIPPRLATAIEELLEARRFEDLYRVCAEGSSPLARIVLTGLRNAQRPRTEVVELVEFAGRKESASLERNVGILGTIAAISPLLGLFGTVVGIIETFALIRAHGIGNPTVLAGGISQALIATASGIGVAVPSMIFYRYFRERARTLVLELEQYALELVTKLSSGVSPSSSEPERATARQ